MEEQDSSIQSQWIPKTPMKPIAPICPNTAEEQSDLNQMEQMRFVGNKNMSGLDHLSFGDLLALANTASLCFSGQTSLASNVSGTTRNTEMMQKGNNEAVESLSSVSNNVTEEIIKTPEKPKRRKHRPKVIKEAKPKIPREAVVVDGQEGKKPKRKYVRKKAEVNKDQEATPVESAAAIETSTRPKRRCRRALDFESSENGEKHCNSHSDVTHSAHRDSCNQESNDFLSTPKKKGRQSKRKEKEPENNDSNQERDDISMAQAAKRRQGKEPTREAIQYDEQCDYQKLHWLYFPNSSSTSFAGQQLQNVSSFDSNCYSFTSQLSANRIFTMEDKCQGSYQGRQSFESSVRLDKIDTPIKKKTTGHARFRNLSSINKVMEVSEVLPSGCYGKPQQKNKKILVDKPVTSSKKKRITKSEKSQTNQKTFLPNIHQFPASFPGISPDELWKRRYSVSVEAISELLCLLDINREYSETALVPYSMNSQGNEMIVFSSGAGAIVPLTPVKKRRPRPKVDLDSETDRVWKLLLENIDSEGINGSDEQKAKWWKEERNVFRGRADSFIARMHLVQGDRRFTPWKGSVVDSVVGVFLTQNVSDHLSSSAFMSLASEYPVPSEPIRNFDVGTSSIQITYLDSEESMSNPPAQSSVTLNNTQPYEVKDYVDNNEASRSSSEIASSSHDSERAGSNSEINIEVEHRTSFLKLLQGLQVKGGEVNITDTVSLEVSKQKNQYDSSKQEVGVSSNPGSLQVSPNMSPGDCSSEVKEPYCCCQQDGQKPEMPESSSSVRSTKHKEDLMTEILISDINESTSCLDVQEGTEKSPVHDATLNAKGKKVIKEKKEAFDWDSLRREAQGREGKREKTARTLDTVDWESIRTADVEEVAETIKSRGMNHKLAERIQGFLDRLIKDHGGIDLEWLRDVPPDKAKEYLLSFNGLGLKSVECVRLLTLHHLAFPVDTNVGRIAVRLGWVPLQPLPESLQLHLLEMYPVLESIQKYLWPRLCKLDQKTLYELHYQMITFGKVFCTKSKPNCNACPMRGECRHFASAFASARLSLPGTEKGVETPDQNPLPLHLPEPLQRGQGSEVVKHSEPAAENVKCCEPIIEEPASPEPESAQVSIADIEDAFFEDPEEIPTIRLNMDAFTNNLKKIMEEGNMSTALVALTAEAASLPTPKLKNISQLRTEHQVYELPDWHPLLAEMEKREPDDPCSYLLAIWTPGETADSVQPAVNKCTYQGNGKLCDEKTCFPCNSHKEARSQTVRGTILIPCRTAMRGSFPLNGTYFQVNEVFADHASSLNPIDVPRDWLWELARKTVYFGTSIPSIFKGLPTDKIQQCFWKGYVCVRGFDRKTRAPKPLIARLHFPKSKMKSQANPVHPSAK
ncbi:DNA glycosylase/AP lyase ROS1 [Cardamine amara subsp. amara]|uniref:DNA glycosylase/AP lyase ROS1 n=1 Tax=Cardamine amara subsp. amara TaxID=228776 RepID=A0ABD1C4H6_CARAN